MAPAGFVSVRLGRRLSSRRACGVVPTGRALEVEGFGCRVVRWLKPSTLDLQLNGFRVQGREMIMAEGFAGAAIDRTWHIQDSHGHILAVRRRVPD